MQKIDQMVNFHYQDICFNLRTACVCLRDDEVLLFYFHKADLWTLPGGRCDLLETTEGAAKREFKEEIGEDVKILRNLWVIENFFKVEQLKKNYHELLFVYLVELPKSSKIKNQNEFYAHEGTEKMFCRWVKIKDLANYNLLPKFLIKALANIPASTEHIINIDD